MNKGQLIEWVAGELGQSKPAAATYVETILNGIVLGLQRDNGVTISGFGTFAKRQRKPRVGRNPVTGDKMMIDASHTVRFKPSHLLRDAVR